MLLGFVFEIPVRWRGLVYQDMVGATSRSAQFGGSDLRRITTKMIRPLNYNHKIIRADNQASERELTPPFALKNLYKGTTGVK